MNSYITLDGWSLKIKTFLVPEMATNKTHVHLKLPILFLWSLDLMMLIGASTFSGHWKGGALKIQIFLGPNGTHFVR
jgi:hypothetical protein